MRGVRAVRAEMPCEGDFSRWEASERGAVYCLHAMHSAMPPKQQKHTADIYRCAHSAVGRRLPGKEGKRILSIDQHKAAYAMDGEATAGSYLPVEEYPKEETL